MSTHWNTRVARIVVFGLVCVACTEPAGAPAETAWEIELSLDQLIVLGSCDGPGPLLQQGTGDLGEFVFRVTLEGATDTTLIIAESQDYPSQTYRFNLREEDVLRSFPPVRTRLTVPVGEVASMGLVFEAGEWDTEPAPFFSFPPLDPRLAAPVRTELSSADGFSPGTKSLMAGTDGFCRLQANIDITATAIGG